MSLHREFYSTIVALKCILEENLCLAETVVVIRHLNLLHQLLHGLEELIGQLRGVAVGDGGGAWQQHVVALDKFVIWHPVYETWGENNQESQMRQTQTPLIRTLHCLLVETPLIRTLHCPLVKTPLIRTLQ